MLRGPYRPTSFVKDRFDEKGQRNGQGSSSSRSLSDLFREVFREVFRESFGSFGKFNQEYPGESFQEYFGKSNRRVEHQHGSRKMLKYRLLVFQYYFIKTSCSSVKCFGKYVCVKKVEQLSMWLCVWGAFYIMNNCFECFCAFQYKTLHVWTCLSICFWYVSKRRRRRKKTRCRLIYIYIYIYIKYKQKVYLYYYS